jgi:chaperone modulatory protein CbpM
VKISEQEFLAVSGIDSATLQVWLEDRWLVADTSLPNILFSDIDIARARLVQDLKHAMGINDPGVSVVLDLVDQIHGLRRQLRDLRDAIQNARG